MEHMPISLWIQWKAWWKFQGPPRGLQIDYLAAELTKWVSVPYTAPENRRIGNYLGPWRNTGDYKTWFDFGPDADPERTEYTIE